MKGQKHHYIPVFYLKQWAGDDGRLCEYSRPHRIVTPHRRHPSETGFERGLYTLSTFPAEVSDVVERKLMRATDDYASRALRKLLNNEITALTGDDRVGWARFITSLMRRTPEALANTAAMLRATFEAEAALALPGDPTPDEQLRAEKQLLERHQALLLQNTINSQTVIQCLVTMRWSVLSFAGLGKHSLLTSDRPFLMTNGIGLPNSHIAIPINPAQCFIAAANEQEERRLRSIDAAHIAAQLNDRLARQARKFVYGADDRQLRFVANRLGKMVRAAPTDPL